MNRIGIAVLLGLLAAATARGQDKKADKPRPKFTIGKETTHVTAPVDVDGFIDFAAALNERLGKGITPEQNANVLLWKAMGPRPEGSKMPREYFRWMAIGTLPDDGDYFIDARKFMKEHGKLSPSDDKGWSALDDELERITQRPWTAKEFPDLAAWLKANEKPLALVVAACKRPRYFSPLIPGRGKDGSSAGLIGALVSSVQKCREFAQALAARAMLEVGEQRTDDAWQDLLAMHRLGRLVGQGGTLIEYLVGVAIESIASAADLAFLERAKLDTPRIKACLRDLKELPPRSTVADKVDLGERFMFLDSVMLVARHGPDYLESLAGGAPSKGSNPILKIAFAGVDWDPALRNGNLWYDRMVAAMRRQGATRSSARKQLYQLDVDIKELKANIFPKSALGGVKMLLGLGAATRSKMLADIMISLLVPAVRKVQQAGDRSEQVEHNLHLAFALAAYRRDHGKYPAKLDALAPDYLAAVPQDLFSGKPLIYRPDEKGYLLYSVGINGVDEGGRWYDDEPPGDDPGVRMPLPELRKK